MGTISNTRTHLHKNNTHAHVQSHAQGRASGNQSLRIPPVAAIITNLTPPQPHGNSNKWKHTFSTLVSTTGGESPAATHMATPVATPPAVFSSGLGNAVPGGTFAANSTNYNYNYAISSNIMNNNNNNNINNNNNDISNKNISSTASSGDGRVVVKKPTPKVFQCCGYGDCSMIFSRKFFLERHIRMHKGEKPFQCDVCFKHFSRNDNLKQHKHSVHKEKESDSKTKKVAEEPTAPPKQIGTERKRRASGGEETQETKRKSRAKTKNKDKNKDTGTDNDKDKDPSKGNKKTTPELSITGDVICDADGRPLVVQPMIVTKDSLDTLLHEQHKSAHKRRGTVSSSPDATATTSTATTATTTGPAGSVKAAEKKKPRIKNTTKDKEKTRGEVKHEPRDDSDGDGANTKISIASLIT